MKFNASTPGQFSLSAYMGVDELSKVPFTVKVGEVPLTLTLSLPLCQFLFVYQSQLLYSLV